jgi:Sensors of blue-light using FAD
VSVTQLIYASRPFGYDDLALAGILGIARKNNIRDGITGCLICREDLYLQLLEGDCAAVMRTFARITKDDRHTSVTKLLLGDVSIRLFPDWAMKHDPVRSWMWSERQIADGAIERAPADEVLGVFSRVSSELPAN